MRKRISTLTAILVFACLCLKPTSAWAQAQITFNALNIALWPEYDQPTMLVIYKATLASNTSLPANLSIRIPAAAKVHVVAIGDSETTVSEVEYNRQVDGEWAKVNFIATAQLIQLEYYDPGLVKQGQARHFDYVWPGDYAVSNLTVTVQEPAGSSNMSTTPDLGPGEPSAEDGLIYHTGQLDPLTAGQNLKVTVDYQKTNDQLSVENLPVQPSQPITATTTGRNQLRTLLPWAIGVLGIGLIVGGGWWYWQSGHKETSLTHRKRTRGTHRSATEADPAGDVYCHQCGKRAAPADRFCRSCGTKLRVE
jgi:hypothetical protein